MKRNSFKLRPIGLALLAAASFTTAGSNTAAAYELTSEDQLKFNQFFDNPVEREQYCTHTEVSGFSVNFQIDRVLFDSLGPAKQNTTFSKKQKEALSIIDEVAGITGNETVQFQPDKQNPMISEQNFAAYSKRWTVAEETLDQKLQKALGTAYPGRIWKFVPHLTTTQKYDCPVDPANPAKGRTVVFVLQP